MDGVELLERVANDLGAEVTRHLGSRHYSIGLVNGDLQANIQAGKFGDSGLLHMQIFGCPLDVTLSICRLLLVKPLSEGN